MSAVTVKGIVHGNMIHLDSAPGLPDGQEVTVTLAPATSAALAPGEGLKRAFGGWADDTQELENYLQWARQQRKADRRRIEP